DIYVNAERLLAKLFAGKRMAHEALSGRNVAIGLNGPRAYDLPSAFAYALANFLEHRGIGLLNPPIVLGRRMRIAEAGRFLDAIKRAAKCGQRKVRAVAPRPQPGGINMGIRDDVQNFSCGSLLRPQRRRGEAGGSGDGTGDEFAAGDHRNAGSPQRRRDTEELGMLIFEFRFSDT